MKLFFLLTIALITNISLINKNVNESQEKAQIESCDYNKVFSLATKPINNDVFIYNNEFRKQLKQLNNKTEKPAALFPQTVLGATIVKSDFCMKC